MDALHWAVLLIPLVLCIRKFAVWVFLYGGERKCVGWPFGRNKRASRGKACSLTMQGRSIFSWDVACSGNVPHRHCMSGGAWWYIARKSSCDGYM